MLKLIDADALLKSINENRPYNADAVIEEIEFFPTIDAIPVKWLEKKRSYMYPGSEKELIVRRLIYDWREENVS